ncbi:hypothetical protein LUZ60_014591 [Juncus effusus]|nr:hypothetical protein LUZ60_014591 [Juncus effusus]
MNSAPKWIPAQLRCMIAISAFERTKFLRELEIDGNNNELKLFSELSQSWFWDVIFPLDWRNGVSEFILRIVNHRTWQKKAVKEENRFHIFWSTPVPIKSLSLSLSNISYTRHSEHCSLFQLQLPIWPIIMDYERIQKPSPRQGRGFTVSPKKLRSILLGLEKTQKEEEEEEEEEEGVSIAEPVMAELDGRHQATVDGENLECSTSISKSNSNSTENGPHRLKVRIHDEEECFDSDSVTSSFNFQKQNQVVPIQKFKFNAPAALLPPFSKPTPSKWDDAQKWISSPNSNKPETRRRNGKSGFFVNKIVVENQGNLNLKKANKTGVIEKGVFEKTGFEKGIFEESGFEKGGFGKSVSWVDEPFGFVELAGIAGEKPLVDSNASLQSNQPTFNQTDSSHTKPVPKLYSVSMRDMGTEMTPIASQEPSRTATPAQSTTPIRSLDSSRTSTPNRNKEKELELKTRKEIMELGRQLGRPNITAWAKSKGQDGNNAKEKLKDGLSDQDKGVEIRAAEWEEAETAKHLARFKSEENKIQAWENHQKAKIEAEMQKIEVDIERMRARAQEKLMNKLAVSKHKADRKRAKMEAKKKKDAKKTEKQADHIRRTGQVPERYLSCWNFCL